MKVFFDVQHLYYLPQYLPVFEELQSRGEQCFLIFHRNSDYDRLLESVAANYSDRVVWASSAKDALDHYQTETPDWIFFGNTFQDLDKLPRHTRTALLYHGIGVKDCYYDKELQDFDIRFVEGEHRQQEILHRYPTANIVASGFAKLDPLFNGSIDKSQLLKQWGLDPLKKTLLYAPTFYPSSIELFHKDWPQEFWEYNIIIKPHFFSLTKEKYHKQQRLFQHWGQYTNTYVASTEDFNLLPFMAVSDLLISEASSALFEFAAMDKPVVWCDFLKLRWSYRGPLRFRYTRRMDQTILKYVDIAEHARKYQQLKLVVDKEIHTPSRLSEKRKRYTQELIGTTDGRAATRVAERILKES